MACSGKMPSTRAIKTECPVKVQQSKGCTKEAKGKYDACNGCPNNK